MHAEADEWVSRYRTDDDVKVLDIGGRDINGSPRKWFPNADYTVLDILEGPGVDIVADAATWNPDRKYDIVVCTETFEHTEVWREVVTTAHEALKARGVLVLTMAGPGRVPHSAFDGGPVQADEYYENIDPAELEAVLRDAGFKRVEVEEHRPSCDVRAWAKR